MKNLLIVTGGAGFIGSNLIELLLLKTNYKILSIDNYSTGNNKNHIKNIRVQYLKEDTKNISKILKSKIEAIFHFWEFSGIYQSFNKLSECMASNSIGSNEVFNFCFIK